jgi:hypothetical protein
MVRQLILILSIRLFPKNLWLQDDQLFHTRLWLQDDQMSIVASRWSDVTRIKMTSYLLDLSPRIIFSWLRNRELDSIKGRIFNNKRCVTHSNANTISYIPRRCWVSNKEGNNRGKIQNSFWGVEAFNFWRVFFAELRFHLHLGVLPASMGLICYLCRPAIIPHITGRSRRHIWGWTWECMR